MQQNLQVVFCRSGENHSIADVVGMFEEVSWAQKFKNEYKMVAKLSFRFDTKDI